MKYLLIAGAVFTLLSVSTLPASAIICIPESSHASSGQEPPICALPDTKEKHPGWFHDGGYCDGATTVADATAMTHCKVLKGP